jgi:hypothetical protein
LKNEIASQLDKRYKFKEDYVPEDDEDEKQSNKHGGYNMSLVTGIDNKFKYLAFIVIIGLTFGLVLFGLKHLTRDDKNAKKVKKQK